MVLAFFIIQRFLRRTKGAKSFKGGSYDRGNMALIGTATGIGLWLPVIADVMGVAIFPITIIEGLVALAFMMLGLMLRIWSAVVLGAYYTTTLMMTEGQKVVTAGPYGKIRHPGYLGEILLWSGLGVLSDNLIVVFLLPAMILAVLLYRISSEEKMLLKELGDDYAQYQRRTHRLIPFVY